MSRDERDDERHHKRRKHSHEDDGQRDRDHHSSRRKGLPFDATPITKNDMDEYRQVFARYLRDKKDIALDDIPYTEAYGRFKSFVHKWNEGDLSSRYYDPELRQAHRRSSHGNKHPDNSKSDPKSIGVYPHSSKIVGPTLPTAEDIQLQREQRAEDAEKDSEYHHLQRKRERKLEKERLEELVPRAEPGTRDRQLEKRKEVSAAHRAFRDKSPEVTVSDATLMGGDDIKAEFLKEKQKERERELRREEAQRAKDAERLMRRSDLEKKEAGTMEMLKKLAQERWGNTNA